MPRLITQIPSGESLTLIIKDEYKIDVEIADIILKSLLGVLSYLNSSAISEEDRREFLLRLAGQEITICESLLRTMKVNDKLIQENSPSAIIDRLLKSLDKEKNGE